MTQHNIELHIQELVLEGMGPLDGEALQRALSGALAGLLAQRGLPPALSAQAPAPVVDAGTVDVSAEMDAPTVGRRIGQALYGGLGT
jgi:hypothetical protein